MGKQGGPLAGYRVIEFAGLAPVPFAGMILADFGADVIRIDRLGHPNLDTLSRGKRSISLDLKSPAAQPVLRQLLNGADVLLDPFRPGVLERLGWGPEPALACNPRLVYARLTGYGQSGPLSQVAGHDLNYVAMSGLLPHLSQGKGQPPFPPLNLLGDFAGGSLVCVLGILMALLERHKSGRGQVVDAAMAEGALYLGGMLMGLRQLGVWRAPPGDNLLDSGAPFYNVYRTRDDRFLAVAPIEPQFYAEFLERLPDLSREQRQSLAAEHRMDQERWPTNRGILSQVIRQRSLQEWTQIYEGTDACVTPVLELEDLLLHPHSVARRMVLPMHPEGSFSADEDPAVNFSMEPAPAPRLSRTPAVTSAHSKARPKSGEHTWEVLQEFGFVQGDLRQLAQQGVIPEPSGEPAEALRSRL